MIRGADISIAQLRVLMMVAEEGAYTRAAARLGVSQSGVSHAMQALEALAGGPLVSKTAHGVALTALGEIVLASAKKITNELQVLSQHVGAFHGEPGTALTLGVIPSALSGWLSSPLSRFTQRYPQAISLVLEGMEEEIKEWVESGVVDIGITTDVTWLNLAYWREHFEWELLRHDEIKAVVAQHHPLAQHESVTLAALAEHPLIMSSGGCEALIQQIFKYSMEAADIFQVDFWVRDTQTLLQMVAAEVGVSLVPALALTSSTVEGVVTLPLAPKCERQLIAFWPKKHALNPTGRHWLNEITTT